MSDALQQDLSEFEARQITNRIAQALSVSWELIAEAYVRRVWLPLGYESWDDYCQAEFPTAQLRLPREERQEVVASLREQGMSVRAIAAATGESSSRVHRDTQSTVPSETLAPANVTGINGKRYAPQQLSRQSAPPAPSRVHTDQDIFDAEIVDEETPASQSAPEPAQPEPQRRRRPITDSANDNGWELRKSAERLARLLDDDRYSANKKQVALSLRGHLLYVQETITAALAQLDD